MKKWWTMALLFVVGYLGLSAQNVVVSDPIDLDNNGKYEIIGQFDNKLLLYRDNQDEIDILAFNQNMQNIWTKRLEKEFEDVKTAGIVANDEQFHVFLAYSYKDSTYLYHYAYDGNGNLKGDKTLILSTNELGRSFYFKHSQDRSKVLFFQAAERSSMRLIAYDIPDRQLSWNTIFKFDDKVRNQFLGVEFSNAGEAFLVLDNENRRFDRDEHYFKIFYYQKGLVEAQVYEIPFSGFLTQSIKILFDEMNHKLNVTGYYTKRNLSRAEGIFYFTFHPRKSTSNIVRSEWNNSVKQNVYGPQGRDAEGIQHLELKKVILREDGGLLLLGEIEKIYERRAAYSERTLYNGGSNWVDFIYEDLVLVSLHPNGEWHWSKVLHKRQFSQDDNAIYSSFYLFHVPSFIRIIYNDEISNNSTASAYEVFTDGSYARSSILSTQYQKLQLRFQEAFQYSSTAMIVPSEYKGDLKLVQIKF